jgi:GntR family transcriptional repressor for pyruvate dehydrogenase complex
VSIDRDAGDSPALDYLRQVPRDERLADKVAGLLKKAILGGQLRPGDRLPPERLLGERFGVSRTVVREAIRSLAAKGLVEVRSGSGTVVATVDGDSVTEVMQLYLRGASLDHDAIDEVRVMVEVDVAGLAAERAGESDLDDLRDILLAMAATARDRHRCAVHDAEFHRSVARATHNALLVVVMEAIAESAPAVREGTLSLPGRVAKAIAAHRRILERIEARDPTGAREAMREHLVESREAWERFLRLNHVDRSAVPELEAAE